MCSRVTSTTTGTGLTVNDGWLHTGDKGTMDADGYVTFTGVMKAMFTRNGFNIYPSEIERVVGAMPGVKSVKVRAIPDSMRENDIALEITGAVTEESVHAWCKANLAVYKQPSRIDIALARAPAAGRHEDVQADHPEEARFLRIAPSAETAPRASAEFELFC